MKEHFEQLKSHPRVARGWRVYSVMPGNDLRWVERDDQRVLQQNAGVRWHHDHEQHTGGGYYSCEDTTSEWFDVPLVSYTQEATVNATRNNRLPTVTCPHERCYRDFEWRTRSAVGDNQACPHCGNQVFLVSVEHIIAARTGTFMPNQEAP